MSKNAPSSHIAILVNGKNGPNVQQPVTLGQRVDQECVKEKCSEILNNFISFLLNLSYFESSAKGDICNGAPEQVKPCRLEECLSQWGAWNEKECKGHQTDDSGQQCGKGMKELRRKCPGPHRCDGMYTKFEECYSKDCLQWSG